MSAAGSGEIEQRALDTLRIIYSSPVCPEHLRITIRERHGAYPMFDGGPTLAQRAADESGSDDCPVSGCPYTEPHYHRDELDGERVVFTAAESGSQGGSRPDDEASALFESSTTAVVELCDDCGTVLTPDDHRCPNDDCPSHG